MTNKQRVISQLGFDPPKNSVEGELLDTGISPEEEYTGSNSIALKTVALSICKIILTTADHTNENGFSVKYDRNAVLKRIADLEDELGLTARPTITSKRVW